MLTHHQKETFETKGLIRLDGFLPQDKVARCSGIYLSLSRKGGHLARGGLAIRTNARPT